MRIVLLASGAFALPTFRWLLTSGHEIVRVVTQPERISGRGRKSTPTPVHQAALERGLPVLAVEDVNAQPVLDELAAAEARLGLVIAFGQKLGTRLTSSDGAGVFRSGCVNLHASLLPRHRGAAPINYAILRGDAETGVTLFRLTQELDGGSILITRRTPIGPEETADELHDRLALLGVEAVQAALALFDGDPQPRGTAQDPGGVTRAPKLKKEDGHIDFARPADEVCRHIRAMWSWPGAVCDFVFADGVRRERVTLARARPAAPHAAGLPPGALDERLFAATQPGAIEIVELKPASSRLMSWRDFVNGRRVTPTDRFSGVRAGDGA